MEHIAKNIRQRRKQMGLSQEQLAVLLEVSKATVSNYERDRTDPSPQIMERLSQILDMPISRFFLREQEEPFSDEMVTGGLDIISAARYHEDGRLYLTVRRRNNEITAAYEQYPSSYFRVCIPAQTEHPYLFMEKCTELPEEEGIIYACADGGAAKVYKYTREGDVHVLRSDTNEYRTKYAGQITVIGIQRI